MDETFTKTLNVTTNKTAVQEIEAIELLSTDEMMFYQIIRSDLDSLQRVPQQQTVDKILSFSKALRK